MKRIILALLTTSILVFPVSSETITIYGRTLTLPDSKVVPALRNSGVTDDAEALLEGRYAGTARARQIKRLITRLRRQGPTDENLATLVELKKAPPSSGPAVNRPVELSPRQVAFNAAIARGFDTRLGFKLPLEDSNRSDFTQLTVLVSTSLQTGAIDPDTPQTFTDMSGESRTLGTADFLRLMLDYGNHYKRLRDQLRVKD